jgi:hypothetical protein
MSDDAAPKIFRGIEVRQDRDGKNRIVAFLHAGGIEAHIEIASTRKDVDIIMKALRDYKAQLPYDDGMGWRRSDRVSP